MSGRKSGIARLFVGAIAVLMVCAGVWFLTSAGETRTQAQTLRQDGHQSRITDARVRVLLGSDGERRVHEVEVSFAGSDGSPTTGRLRTIPVLSPVAFSGPNGWEDEFIGKADLVGAPVRYLPGTPPTVELESELSAQEGSPWGFFDILGVALCVMGGFIVVIVSISALRSRYRSE